MSWDVSLLHPITREVVDCGVNHGMTGGTFAIEIDEDGNYMPVSSLLELNVTYNYSPHYYRVLDTDLGLRWLHDKTASETIPKLKEAISLLGEDVDPDYWKPTEGNARKALEHLLAFAEKAPDAIC